MSEPTSRRQGHPRTVFRARGIVIMSPNIAGVKSSCCRSTSPTTAVLFEMQQWRSTALAEIEEERSSLATKNFAGLLGYLYERCICRFLLVSCLEVLMLVRFAWASERGLAVGFEVVYGLVNKLKCFLNGWLGHYNKLRIDLSLTPWLQVDELSTPVSILWRGFWKARQADRWHNQNKTLACLVTARRKLQIANSFAFSFIFSITE